MTAILGFIYEEVPCFLGDLLISSEGPHSSVPIPVSGIPSDQQKIQKKKKVVAGLHQKLIQIGEHMMIAISSKDLDKTMVLVRKLKSEYDNRSPRNISELEEICYSIKQIDLEDSSIIFLIAIEDGWRMKSVNAIKAKMPSGEMIATEGTGYKFAMEVFSHEIVHNDNSKTAFQKAYGRLLLAAGRMWSWDFSGLSIENAFGGGYEIAIRQNNRIVKVGDILYVSFEYFPDSGLGIHALIKKVDYIDDILVLTILELKPNSSKKDIDFEITRPIQYFIPSPCGRQEKPTKEELDKLPSLNATHYVTHIKINSQVLSKEPYSSSLSETPKRDDLPIEFKYNEKSKLPVEIFYMQRYLDKVVTEVVEVLQIAEESFNEDHLTISSPSISSSE